MSKYKYSKEERRINNVLKYQSGQLEQIKTPDMNDVEARIVESEELLRRLGYGDDVLKIKNAPVSSVPKKVMVVPTWDELCAEAEKMVGDS